MQLYVLPLIFLGVLFSACLGGEERRTYFVGENKEILGWREEKHDEQGRLTEEALFGNLTGALQSPIELGLDGAPTNPVESSRRYFTYEAGRLASISNEEGEEILFTYDDQGLLQTRLKIDAHGYTFRSFFSYDACGNEIGRGFDDGASFDPKDFTGASFRFEERSFAGEDELQVERLAVDLSTGSDVLLAGYKARYSLSGELVEEQFLGADHQPYYHQLTFKEGETTYKIDNLNNTACFDAETEEASIPPQEGEEKTSSRLWTNLRGQKIREEHPDGRVEEWRYTPAGSPCLYTDPTGVSTRLVADGLGRVLAAEKLGVDGEPLGQQESWEYGLAGPFTHVDEVGQTTFYNYDKVGRLMDEGGVDTDGDLCYSKRYEYNARNRVEAVFEAVGKGEKKSCASFYLVDSLKGLYDGVVNSSYNVIQGICPFSNEADYFKEGLSQLIGNGILLMSGYEPESSSVGVVGKGEVSNAVRVTFLNGILTPGYGMVAQSRMISETHGNTNVHYVHRATEGWTFDVLRSSLTKGFGYRSPQAYLLAETWKRLLREMEEQGEKGIIIHYAHSIGTADSIQARSMLSAEDAQKIRVHALGPATIVDDEHFESVTNYISARDGVCLLDPVGMLEAILNEQDHVVFIGSPLDGVPLVDHLFTSDTYREVWRKLGEEFVSSYGSLE